MRSTAVALAAISLMIQGCSRGNPAQDAGGAMGVAGAVAAPNAAGAVGTSKTSAGSVATTPEGSLSDAGTAGAGASASAGVGPSSGESAVAGAAGTPDQAAGAGAVDAGAVTDSDGGATSSSERDAASPQPACSKAFAPGLTSRSLTAAGATRTYWLFVPQSYDGSQRVALVFNLHGRLSDPTQQMSVSDLNSKAEREGFVVVTPQCIGDAWNVDLDPAGPDDVAFVDAMIDELERTLCIDAKRIYSTGLSAGGRMSSRLACELSERIAAVAPVGGVRYPQPCRAGRPVALVTFHGTSDNVNPYEGGGEAYWGTGVEDAMEKWAAHDGCSTTAAISSVSDSVDKLEYKGCAAGVELVLYRVTGGGHTWPGSPNPPSPLLLGPTTQEISANDLLWAFFEAHPLP